MKTLLRSLAALLLVLVGTVLLRALTVSSRQVSAGLACIINATTPHALIECVNGASSGTTVV